MRRAPNSSRAADVVACDAILTKDSYHSTVPRDSSSEPHAMEQEEAFRVIAPSVAVLPSRQTSKVESWRRKSFVTDHLYSCGSPRAVR